MDYLTICYIILILSPKNSCHTSYFTHFPLLRRILNCGQSACLSHDDRMTAFCVTHPRVAGLFP
ncbi:protein of unknown function [uncultured Sphingopyxis sp.]|uniref:Uncharacterized protein n=1 Tax=uncultured Sphingopyxis sp. TaxID=310581 RepID=A0A1Y5PS90_9SPHN|nr:protein of unknown function [uncultured Sphingopyxis sp.]